MDYNKLLLNAFYEVIITVKDEEHRWVTRYHRITVDGFPLVGTMLM